MTTKKDPLLVSSMMTKTKRQRQRQEQQQQQQAKERNQPKKPLISRQYGVSTLHFIFTLRRYLKQIIDHGIVARLIFFSNPSPETNLQNSQYTFYRHVAATHLMALAHPMIQFSIFDSITSPTFEFFLSSGIREQFILCEAIALDVRYAFAADYCQKLTEILGVYVIHLPTVSNPYGVASIIELEKKIAFRNRFTFGGVLPIQDSPAAATDENDPVLESLSSPQCRHRTRMDHISFETLCQLLGKMFEESGDMAMKSLICSHLLTLFVQSSLPLDQRGILGSNLPSHFAKLVTLYFSQFHQVLLHYWQQNELLLLLDCPETVAPRDKQNETPICDLWDGTLLGALFEYCNTFGYQALYSALPDRFQRTIWDHFPPAQYFNWNRPTPLQDLPPKEFKTENILSYPPLIEVFVSSPIRYLS
jgi:hypothetical protein